ncbi:NAD(P)/FAD-dependent oxidoreductase [Saccharopolyspora tripterygii]
MKIETDYLVVGAGAMSLAFIDTILDETDADVVVVDRYDKPGGHWRVAYDFVRLHQPSDFYGVNSRPLGSGVVETRGHNAGLLELASADELRDYFEKVMNDKFLASGRVRYLPNSEYLGDGKVSRILSGELLEITPRRRVVDGTFMNVEVPAATPPRFQVRDGVQPIPPNGLVRIRNRYDKYVVLGAGKTAIDTVLWLLERGTAPEAVSWVVPREAWLYNRAVFQPGPEFAPVCDSFNELFYGAWLESETLDELYDRLVDAEYFFRLSDDVRPTAFRCATVTKSEVEDLRRIDDVVRLGRVREINQSGLILENGSREYDGEVLYINCTADGLSRIEGAPVFAPGLIRLQAVVGCQQVYSASLIAHIEARPGDDEMKNRLTAPVPHPYDERDLITTSVIWFRNELRWADDPELLSWREGVRLAGQTTRIGTPIPSAGPERELALAEFRQLLAMLVEKGEMLIGTAANAEPGERADAAM